MSKTTAPAAPAEDLRGALIIGGKPLRVEGVKIVNVHDDKRARLDPGDYRKRAPEDWPRQIIIHTTKGIWPQTVTPGAGPEGKHLAVAEFWRGDPEHSGASLVCGRAGEFSCLCDLLTEQAHHATVSNRWSIGIEMYQEGDGSIREATLDATVLMVLALSRAFGIQLQVPGRAYRRAPMARMVDGGPSVVGVFGHRDNTHRRGQGDPGDEIFRRLIAAGAEPIVTDNGQDLHLWAERQKRLGVAADGIPGPRTAAALAARGFPGGVWALGTDAQRADVMREHQRG